MIALDNMDILSEPIVPNNISWNDPNLPDIFLDSYTGVIRIMQKKVENIKEQMLNDLREALKKCSPNVVLIIRAHGSPTDSCISIGETDIESSEIVDIVLQARTEGKSIFGILQICYGLTYKNLTNAFNACIACDISIMTSPINPNKLIANFCDNVQSSSKSMHDEFINTLVPEYIKDGNNLLFAWGDNTSNNNWQLVIGN